MSLPVNTRHIFTAAEPEKKPVGFVWWKEGPRRATCSCGWEADHDSANTAEASRAYGVHRAEADRG